jgi:cellulose synthase (UDP-forming)
VTRRAALRTIGDKMPTQSITEDMLLSLMLLRKGYVTRYLCERLAFGLAPEGLKAFFIQRRRWARGALQIFYLSEGPLGPNLSFMQRLLFLPTHWLSQSLSLLMTIIAPLVFLWTGVLPLVNVTMDSIVHYLVPMVLAVVGGIWVYAPRQYFPLAAQVLGTFQSVKILPTVLWTIVKPFGHVFKVTPKGSEAKQPDYDRGVFWTAATLMALTMGGLFINTLPEWRIVAQGGLVPVVAGWAALNMAVLFLVCMMSLQISPRRGEERFTIDEPVWVIGANTARALGRTIDISLSGAAILANMEGGQPMRTGDSLRLFISEVGYISGQVVRQCGQMLGIRFDLHPSVERDLLVRKLFTSGIDATNVVASAWSATGAVLKSIWSTRSSIPASTQGKDLEDAVVLPSEKLPALSLVIPPHFEQRRLADLVADRRATAA